MGAPNYQAADFATAIQGLLPRGFVWPTDPTAVLTQAVNGLAPTWSTLTARNNNLLIDAFPATAVELLPEWESTLNLPDPCAGLAPTIQQRQAQVVARFTSTGGQSVPYFTQYALSLGYTVTVTEFSPFRMGQSRMGDPLGSDAWAHTWAINAPLNTITNFSMGLSHMGEPLRTWGNAVLECELSAIAPAHTILQFRYS
jgi:uncharacterized protein YmfQ (DUF2313 family)